MGYLTRDQIDCMGFASVGEDVRISDKASFYNCENIFICNHVRIDDFCVISAGLGGVRIGNYVHVAVYSSLIGAGKIVLGDFSNISARVSIYSSTDDFSGHSMTNPTIPDRYKNVRHGDVVLERHVIVGAGSVVLPEVVLEEGVAIGALSLVSKSCNAFGVYCGIPVVRVKERQRGLLEKEKQFMHSMVDSQ